MKYPLGIQSFESLRNDGYAYVDKTAFVYQLARTGKYYFLSRPRRFGKSLFISTLEAYFLGKRELFHGLAIEQSENEWKTYPVLHLDLNSEYYNSVDALHSILNWHFRQWEKTYGGDTRDLTPADHLKSIIKHAYEKTGQKVVLLVDEYDKPLLQDMENPTLQDQLRNTLKSVYGVCKSMDAYIQFGFFTGVSKFSKVSVFSDLNNLTDISLDNRYAEICGITEREIQQYFDKEVDALAVANAISKNECYARLKKNYDGYHFHHKSTGMYNPYSLLNTLARHEFRDYWFETGTPSYIVEVMKRNALNLSQLTEEAVTADMLGSIDNLDACPLPIIYQSGYLTIKDYDSRFDSYTLGFPNEEVSRGFTKFLLPYYTPVKKNQEASFMTAFVLDVEHGHAEQFMQRLERLFAQSDYQIVGDTELYFQNAVWLVFRIMGFYTDVEWHTTDGRLDMLVRTQDFIYIFEFKLDQSADAAIRQIDDKQYAKPFDGDPRSLFKIGVNFSSRTRRIEEWKIVPRPSQNNT